MPVGTFLVGFGRRLVEGIPTLGREEVNKVLNQAAGKSLHSLT